jgi:4-amino-4-deoxy-L-arabinose transferase-like glycosyltransferase
MNPRRWITALALAVGAFALVMTAQKDLGVARDEVVYMAHGSKYAAWWSGALSGKGMVNEAAITAHFGGPGATANNREHPPLMKTLMGFSEKWFHRDLGWAGSISAYRMPSAAMNALLIALVFLFASGIWGYAAGVIAALLTLFLPRAFFHAGLAAFDAAMVTMWMATLMAYYRALGSRRWCVALGLVFGLALATKHNAVMLPAVMLAHYVWVSLWSQGDALRQPGIKARIRAAARGLWSTQPWIAPALVVLGPLVLIATWPWLWFDTLDHLREWMRFHLTHVHYNYEYLGENLNAAPYPWHVPIVTTLLTAPVVTLLAATCGAGALVRRVMDRHDTGQVQVQVQVQVHDEHAPGLLLVLSAGVAMGPFLLGSVPIFGAEKHWAPAMPAICMLAGLGVVAAVELAVARLLRPGTRLETLARGRIKGITAAAVLLTGTLAIAAAAVETAAAHPYALSHYNALAGGAPGGADLGMNRQFWGYAARGALPYLNQQANEAGQPATPVYTHDAAPAWGVYRSAGLVSAKLPDAGHETAGIARSKLAIVIHERHFNRHDYLIWDAYGTVQPVYVLTFQGVPIVSVYARPK